MDTPLLTEDGFPRSDIDVPSIRTARHEIITLRNDHRELEDQIKKVLEKVFSGFSKESLAANDETKLAQEADPLNFNAANYNMNDIISRSKILGRVKPFCVVDSVAVESPAQEAGLCIGDELVHVQNVTSLSELPTLISNNVNKTLDVLLIRGYSADGSTNLVELKLTPHKWQGPGLLGCHLR